MSHFLRSKFTKMSISPSWIVASCSNAQIVLRSTRWCKLYWVALTRRDFDLSQEHYSSVPILSLKYHVFGYFSATTGWNHSLFSVFATLNAILTENRQAKAGRFQIRSLKKFSSYTFYTLGTICKIRIFRFSSLSMVTILLSWLCLHLFQLCHGMSKVLP